jgi:hypothetical protein
VWGSAAASLFLGRPRRGSLLSYLPCAQPQEQFFPLYTGAFKGVAKNWRTLNYPSAGPQLESSG